MGMNYYVVKKSILKKQKELDNLLDKIQLEEVEIKIYNLINMLYLKPLQQLDGFSQENYSDNLKEKIHKFANDISYDVNDVFYLVEFAKIHIGKSSMGWLFCFQDQDNEICKWHTYEEVFNWLYENTVGDNAKYVIIDEEERPQDYEEFKNFVDTKQNDPRNQENPDNFTYSRNVNGYRFSAGDFS